MTTFYDYYFKICGKRKGGDVISHTEITTVNGENFYLALDHAIKLARVDNEIITSIEYLGNRSRKYD